jgi:ATP-dependent protease ClpP protease subunit
MIAAALLLASALALDEPPTDPVSDSTVAGSVVVRIEGEIHAGTALDVQNAVARAKEQKATVINVLLNTQGGGIGAGLDVIAALVESGIPVVCTVRDYALSMGAIILESACSQRIVYAHSLVMFHDGRGMSGDPGTERALRDAARLMAVLNRMIALRVAPRLGITADEYQARTLDKEWWVIGETAVKEGVADVVLPPPQPKAV